MKTYDLIAVLGYGFVDNWQLSDHVRARLQKAAELYKAGAANNVAVCGKWSLSWDQRRITPPTTEAALMKLELAALGIPEAKVLVEGYSKGTIGNAHFLKTTIVEANGYRQVLVLCADYAIERVAYIFRKVFEVKYT